MTFLGILLTTQSRADWMKEHVSGDNSGLYVAIDSAGVLHAMYQIPGNGYGCNCGHLRSFVRMSPGNLKEISDPNNYIDAVRPSMTVDANRNQYVVYEKEWAGQTSIIRYNYQSNNTWTREGPYDIPGHFGYSPRIVIGPTGNIHVVTASGGQVHYSFHAGTANLGSGWVGPSHRDSGGWGDAAAIGADQSDAALICMEIGDGRAGDLLLARYVNGELVSEQQFTATNLGYRWPAMATDFSTGVTYIVARGFEQGDRVERWTRQPNGTISGPVGLVTRPADVDFGPAYVAAREGKIRYMWMQGPGPYAERFSQWWSDGVSAPQQIRPTETITITGLLLDTYGQMYAGATIFTDAAGIGNDMLYYPNASTTGVLSGTVKDPNNNALANVAIIAQTENLTFQTTTSASGFYIMQFMPPGNYSVSVSKLGYVTQHGNATLTASTITTLNFALPINQGGFAGNVKDSIGQALPGVTVTVANISTGTYTATTDAVGNYTLSNVPIGTYSISVKKFGYYSKSGTSTLSIPFQVNSLDYSLTKAKLADLRNLPDGTSVELLNQVVSAVISGQVFVQNPNRSCGMQVYSGTPGLQSGDLVNVSGVMTSNRTSGRTVTRYVDGYATKVGSRTAPRPLLMNNVTVGGQTSGYQTGVADAVGPATGLSNYGLLVQTSGLVTVSDGQFLAICDGSNTPNSYGSAYPGVLVKGPTSPAPYQVGAYVSVTGIVSGNMPNGWTLNQRYMLVPSWSSVQELIASPTLTVKGTVVDGSSNIVSGASVTTNVGNYSATTNSQGAYTFAAMMPGAYTITGAKSGYNNATASVTGAAGQTLTQNLTITVQAGTLTGMVKDQSNSPLSGVTVATTPGNYSATTNASGIYTISNVTPGSYTLSASKTAYLTQTLSSVSVINQATTTVGFTMPPNIGTISGFVKTTSNNPILGATVSTNPTGYTATTDSTGSYTLANVPGGTYSVTASKLGYGPITNSGVIVIANTTTTSKFLLPIVTEKVVNGNMESGFFSTGWGSDCSGQASALPNGYGWNQESTYPYNMFNATNTSHSATHSLGFSFCQTTGSPGKIGIASQVINLGAANGQATFSVWGYHTNGNNPSIMCWNPGANNNPYTAVASGHYQFISTDAWNQTNTWINRTMIVTADSTGRITVMVGGAAWDGTPSQNRVYIDDVSVK